MSSGQDRPLFKRKQHIQVAKLFRFGNRRATREVKHRLPAVILAKPASRQLHPPRLALRQIPHKNFPQLGQSLRKIRQQFRRHLALVPARAKNMRHRHPALWRAVHLFQDFKREALAHFHSRRT